eukprot:6175197-Pleurochrysis_carterae.AAC.2
MTHAHGRARSYERARADFELLGGKGKRKTWAPARKELAAGFSSKSLSMRPLCPSASPPPPCRAVAPMCRVVAFPHAAAPALRTCACPPSSVSMKLQPSSASATAPTSDARDTSDGVSNGVSDCCSASPAFVAAATLTAACTEPPRTLFSEPEHEVEGRRSVGKHALTRTDTGEECSNQGGCTS